MVLCRGVPASGVGRYMWQVTGCNGPEFGGESLCNSDAVLQHMQVFISVL